MSRIIEISLLCFSMVIFFSPSCAGEISDVRSKGNPMATKTIEQVLKEHARELMSIPDVVGVGQGLCERNPCIKVFVIKRTPELEQKIPKKVNGYQVVLEETGEIKALPKQ